MTRPLALGLPTTQLELHPARHYADHVYVGTTPGGCQYWAHRDPGETDQQLAAKAATVRAALAAAYDRAAAG